MGKLSRLKRVGNSPRNPVSRLREAVKDRMDNLSDDIVAQVAVRLRSDPRYLARWREYSGAEDDQHIDYGNPCVEIEFMACDPSLLGLAARDGERFLEETGCDRETFMRYYDQSAENP